MQNLLSSVKNWLILENSDICFGINRPKILLSRITFFIVLVLRLLTSFSYSCFANLRKDKCIIFYLKSESCFGNFLAQQVRGKTV